MKLNEYIKFEQKGITTYMFYIDAETFVSETTVDYFIDGKKEDNGYQRPLSEIHYKSIAKYLLNDNQSMLPTAVIGAIGEKHITESTELEINDSIRIVDGQHRREALRFIKDNDPTVYDSELKEMKFPVLLMEIDKKDLNAFIVEVQTFVNINKKGRKVSTDLALSLEEIISDKLLKNEGFTNKSMAITLIAKEIIFKFNRDEQTCWYGMIKTGDKNDKGRPISKNAFFNSIEAIINSYIDNKCNVANYDSKLISDVSAKVYEILKEVWARVSEKWSECFYWDDTEKYAEYDKDYSVQKGIGVYPIHGMVSDLMIIKGGVSLENFYKTIDESNVVADDWMKGSIFSGYNSASGFKKIKAVLKSNQEYEKLKRTKD